MRRITLRVPEDVLEKARRYAARRNMTIPALLREYMSNIARDGERAEAARARLLELSQSSGGSLAGKSWTRGELHERCGVIWMKPPTI